VESPNSLFANAPFAIECPSPSLVVGCERVMLGLVGVYRLGRSNPQSQSQTHQLTERLTDVFCPSDDAIRSAQALRHRYTRHGRYERTPSLLKLNASTAHHGSCAGCYD